MFSEAILPGTALVAPAPLQFTSRKESLCEHPRELTVL
jgi:hypothetical protein